VPNDEPMMRLYLMFIGPWDMGGPWNPQGIEGVRRFLERAWSVVLEPRGAPAASAGEKALLERDLQHMTHATTKKVSEDIQAFKFNTLVASLMEFNNALMRAKDTAVYGAPAWDEAIEHLLLMLAPIAPHISEELWQRRQGSVPFTAERSIHVHPWPEYDPDLARDETVTLVIQVNGKVRDKFEAPAGIDEAAARAAALGSPAVRKWLEGKNVRKVIYAGGKLVNIVTD
jgi:leucyl-tRNA synthetase